MDNKKQDLLQGLVRGYVWKARMKNGCLFTHWSPESIRVRGRAYARKVLLDLANEPYLNDDDFTYDPSDIVRIWEARS